MAGQDGTVLTRVATPTVAGTYSVSTAGVYTFAAGDASLNMKIDYLFSTAVAPGSNFTINNQLLGVAPVFSVVFNGRYNGKQGTVELLQNVSSKLTLATKLEDWTIPEFDFSCFCNVNNQLAKWSEAD